MNKLLDEKELKALVAMVKELETQIREQSEIARQIAIDIDCAETINKNINKKQKEQKA